MNKLVEALERILMLDTKVVDGGYIIGGYADIAMQALSEHRAEPSADVVSRVEMALNPYFEPLPHNAHKQKQMAAVRDVLAAMQKGE